METEVAESLIEAEDVVEDEVVAAANGTKSQANDSSTANRTKREKK